MEKVHVDEPADCRRIEVPRFVEDLEDESQRTERKPAQEGRNRARAVHTRPENAEDEAHGDRRADVGLNRLQVDEQLRADQSDERHPQHAEQHEHARGGPAEVHELPLVGVRRDLLVEIERHQRRCRVEHRAHRPHQRRHQRGDHHADQARRQQVDDEQRVRDVAVHHLAVADREGVAIERECDQPGQHQHEHGKDLEIAGENRSRPRMALVLRRQHALHDYLVGAPVPDAENRRAEEDAGPWEVGIAERLDHVKVALGHGRPQPGEAAGSIQTDHRQDHRPRDENQRLDEIGIDDRGQPSGDRVHAGRDHENQRRRQRVPSHHALEDDPCGIEVNGNLREDVGENGDAGKVDRAGAAEPALQELGHREHVRPQVERHEHPSEQQHDQTREPLEVAHRKTRRGAGPGQADEMLRRDVRHEQRRADCEPADVAAREEIVGGGPLLERKIEPDREDDDEVGEDDPDVDRFQVFVRQHAGDLFHGGSSVRAAESLSSGRHSPRVAMR